MRNERGHGTDDCTALTRAKISVAQSGSLGYQWRGDDVGYSGIHKRARAVLPRECANADQTCLGRLEVALRSDATGPLRQDKRGWYSASIDDYFRLCRSHHNRYDGKRPPARTQFGALARA
jgi:hypothetical protein